MDGYHTDFPENLSHICRTKAGTYSMPFKNRSFLLKIVVFSIPHKCVYDTHEPESACRYCGESQGVAHNPEHLGSFVSVYTFMMFIYIYISIHSCICIYLYIYIFSKHILAYL